MTETAYCRLYVTLLLSLKETLTVLNKCELYKLIEERCKILKRSLSTFRLNIQFKFRFTLKSAKYGFKFNRILEREKR